VLHPTFRNRGLNESECQIRSDCSPEQGACCQQVPRGVKTSRETCMFCIRIVSGEIRPAKACLVLEGNGTRGTPYVQQYVYDLVRRQTKKT